MEFDPYHQWLAIAPEEPRPPNHYQLLGLREFETDMSVIANAANQRITYVRSFQSGPNLALTLRILHELGVARDCLLTPHQKAIYDAQFREAKTIMASYGGSPGIEFSSSPVRPRRRPRSVAKIVIASGCAIVLYFLAYYGVRAMFKPKDKTPTVASKSADTARPLSATDLQTLDAPQGYDKRLPGAGANATMRGEQARLLRRHQAELLAAISEKDFEALVYLAGEIARVIGSNTFEEQAKALDHVARTVRDAAMTSLLAKQIVTTLEQANAAKHFYVTHLYADSMLRSVRRNQDNELIRRATLCILDARRGRP